MHVAITGSSGFVGQVLCRNLLNDGHHLRLLFRNRQPSDLPNGTVTYVQGDLSNLNSLMALVEGADAVIHLAAKLSVADGANQELFHINAHGTQLLLDASRQKGVKRFIYLSSVNAYPQKPLNESLNETRATLKSGISGYDLSKAVSQDMVVAANNAGMETIVLAPTAIIGPYDEQPSPMGVAMIKIYNQDLPALFRGGVDFVDVRDVAQAVTEALTSGTPGKVYLLGGEWMSLTGITEEIARIKGEKIRIPVLPGSLLLAVQPFIKVWARLTKTEPLYTKYAIRNLLYSNRHIDHSLAEKELRFRPRPLCETLRDAITWFKENGKLT